MLGKSTHILPHMLQYASAYALAFSATFPTGTSAGSARGKETILLVWDTNLQWLLRNNNTRLLHMCGDAPGADAHITTQRNSLK